MGTIKIEFDLPEFKDELQINVVIRKDGEVICNQVASPKPANNIEEKCSAKTENPLLKKAKESNAAINNKQENPNSSGKTLGGNLMSMDIF